MREGGWRGNKVKKERDKDAQVKKNSELYKKHRQIGRERERERERERVEEKEPENEDRNRPIQLDRNSEYN